MFINEYKPEFQLRKSPKNAEFRQFLNLRVLFCHAQNGLDIHLKIANPLVYTVGNFYLEPKT